MIITKDQQQILRAVLLSAKKEHLASLISSGMFESLGISHSDYLANLDDDRKIEIVKHCFKHDLLIDEIFSDKDYLNELIVSVSQAESNLLIDILKHKDAPDELLIDAAKFSPMISVICQIAKLNKQTVNTFLYALPISELDQVVIDILLTYGDIEFTKKVELSKQ